MGAAEDKSQAPVRQQAEPCPAVTPGKALESRRSSVSEASTVVLEEEEASAQVHP